MTTYTPLRVPSYEQDPMPTYPTTPMSPGVFVQNGDILILSLTTSDSSGSVAFNGRILRLDGEISSWNETLTFSGTGTQTDKTVPMATGWLIGFDVSRVSGTLTEGEVNASVHLGRNTGSLQQKLVCLASGDVTNIRSLGMGCYTYSTPASVTAIPTITVAQISNPAAGAELTVTVTSGQVWEIQAFRAIFTTSATVANREVSLRANDGTNTFIASASTTNQTAGTARGYNWADFGAAWTSSLAATFMVPFPRLMLGAGSKLFTVTSNIDATDAWTSCFFSYRLYS